MCNPALVAVAGLALSAGTTVYQVSEQNSNIKAQNQINQEAADEGSKLAAESFSNQANALNLRTSQEEAAGAQEKLENAKRGAEARATARVSAGEAGVAGASVDALIQDFYAQEAGFAGNVDQSLSDGRFQTKSELAGLRSGAVDRSLSFKRPTLQRASYAAAGAQLFGQALGTYDNYKYRTDKVYRGEG